MHVDKAFDSCYYWPSKSLTIYSPISRRYYCLIFFPNVFKLNLKREGDLFGLYLPSFAYQGDRTFNNFVVIYISVVNCVLCYFCISSMFVF